MKSSQVFTVLAVGAALGGAWWWYRNRGKTPADYQLPATPTPLLDYSQPGAYTTPGINLLFDIGSGQSTTQSILDNLLGSNALNSTAPGGASDFFTQPYQSADISDSAGYVMKNWVTPKAGETRNGEAVIYDGFRWEPRFLDASMKYSIPPGVLSRLAWQESRYNPNAFSVAGAVGMMQIIPRFYPSWTEADIRNPDKAIYYAAKILSDNFKKYGDWPKAIVAYNQGQGNVDKAVKAAVAAGQPFDWLNYPPIGPVGRKYVDIARDTGLWPTIVGGSADRTA